MTTTTKPETTEHVAELARAAGRDGREWGSFCCDDAVQDYLCDHGADDVDAWRAAYDEGVAEHRAATGWATFWTTAPEGYDTGDVVDLGWCGEWRGRQLRRVLVGPRSLAYIAARYSSGLHPLLERDPREEDREAEERHAAIRADLAAREARRAEGLAWLRAASAPELDALRSGDMPVGDLDGVEARGLTYADLREETRRRAAELAESERAATWERCRASFADGAIMVDEGAPARHDWIGGVTPGRPARVHYGCAVAAWPRVAEEVDVRDDAGERVGSLASVADGIADGRLRLVAAGDVPPAPVTRRIGADKYREIRRMVIRLDRRPERVVWVGWPAWERIPLVLDERGRAVRALAIREAAINEYIAGTTT